MRLEDHPIFFSSSLPVQPVAHRLCLHVVFIVRAPQTASHSFQTSMKETRFTRILPIGAKEWMVSDIGRTAITILVEVISARRSDFL